jgi:hypothetical protein
MRLAATISLAATALLLSGCAPDDHQLTPGSTPAPTVIDSTPDPSADPVNESIGINCQTLVPDQVMYDWGSGNFALDVDYLPPAGSAAEKVASSGGLACSWVNLSSGEKVDIAAARPATTDLEAAESAAAQNGSAVADLGSSAYFGSDGTVGHLDVFTDTYWVTADSPWFLEAGDARPLAEAAIAALD